MKKYQKTLSALKAKKNKVSFLKKCFSIDGEKLKEMPAYGAIAFSVRGKGKTWFLVEGYITNHKFVDLALKRAGHQVQLMNFYNARDKHARWVLTPATLQHLEYMFTPKDALSCIWYARLLAEDIQLLIETLEAEKKLKKIGLT